MRSASSPAIMPPSAEAISAEVPMKPACPLLMPHSDIRVGMAKANNWTSIASSAQPRKQAQKVLRWGAVIVWYQDCIVPPPKPEALPLLSFRATIGKKPAPALGAGDITVMN